MFGWYRLAIVIAEVARQSKNLVEKFQGPTVVHHVGVTTPSAASYDESYR